MLRSLFIKNFGLIDLGEIHFEKGLNILTGETGAGKSIILDALMMVLGSRASLELIRTGASKAIVSGLFDIAELPKVIAYIEELAIPMEDDGSLILSRELNRNGKNICKINGQILPLSQYRSIGSMLVELQGQQEQQTLMHTESQLTLLDSFGGKKQQENLIALSVKLQEWKQKKKKLSEWEENSKNSQQRLEILSYQLAEIDDVQIKPDEYEDLLLKRNQLANAEKIKSLANECHGILHSGTSTIPVMDLLDKSCRILEQLTDLDSTIKPYQETLLNCLYQVEDVAREMAGYLDKIDFNPINLETIEARLSKLETLFKKYGGSAEKVLQYRNHIADELDTLHNGAKNQDMLISSLENIIKDWNALAEEISTLRQQSAKILETAVSQELTNLKMGKVNFRIEFTTIEDISEKGKERIEFMVAPNQGEPLRPLGKIASGGELSRIMLAIKTVFATVEDIPTLVFDEVDAGIGGKALQAVAIKLFLLGQKRQVICVTHAASIAAKADLHYFIYKEEKEQRTITKIKKLEDTDIVRELARMLGGEDSEIAKEHAKQLLNHHKKEVYM